MSLSSLVSLKVLLGVSGSSQDTLLQQLLDAADAAVKRYCKRDLESQSYTDYFDGPGHRDLLLRQRPVTAVGSVYEDAGGYYGAVAGAFAASTLLTSGTDYALVKDGPGGRGESGMLRRLRPAGLVWAMPGWGDPTTGTLFGGIRGPVWPSGTGNLRVAYTAGYVDVPDDLAQAVNQLAAWMRVAAPRGGIIPTNESLGRYSYGLGQVASTGLSSAPELGSTRQLLAAYREQVL